MKMLGHIILFSVLIAPFAFASDIVGSWVVYHDDDAPDKTEFNETMMFDSIGNFRIIMGEKVRSGQYSVADNTMTFIFNVNGQQLTVPRNFLLKDGELLFKNEKVGYVYYKRINETHKASQ